MATGLVDGSGAGRAGGGAEPLTSDFDAPYPSVVSIVREPPEHDLKGALIASAFIAGIGALLFVWVKSSDVFVPALVLFWPLWGATHSFLVRSGLVSGYRTVGKARFGGTIQRRSTVQVPLTPGFLGAITTCFFISAVAAATS